MSVAPDDGPRPQADLAVVIVNYNTGDYLERCLASLEAHRGDIEVDVLVIDNASQDGSHVAAIDAHPWVRLIENPTNVFLSPAWNQGIRGTSARWILLLNPDVEWWTGTVADLVAVAEGRERPGIVGPLVRNSDGTIYESGRSLPGIVDAAGHTLLSPFLPTNSFTRRYHLDGWDRTSEREVDWVSGCCMLLPRSAFDEVGLLDEGFPLYAEELDLATRLREVGRVSFYTPVVEVVHELGVSTGRSRRMRMMHSASMYRYYRKHRAQGWRRLTLPLAWLALRARVELESIRTMVTDR
jgi:N-acetylglucosaminyl-diphospho-decaprenol L-rhamnosyltransferase